MIRFPHSTVIGDLGSFSRMSMKLMSGHKELWDFLDLSTLIESLVLNDEIILFEFDDEATADIRQPFFDLFDPLVKEGAIRVENYPPAEVPATIPERPVEENLENTIEAQDDPMAMIILEAFNTANAEVRYSCPGLLLTFHQPIYETHASVAPDHRTCDISARYGTFKDSLEELRAASQDSRARYRTLPIPPVANSAFGKCVSLQEAVESTLYVRERFSKLRTKLSELRQILSDDSVPPKKKMSLISSWEKSWLTLERVTGDSLPLQMADTNDFLLKGGDFLLKGTTSPSAWGKLTQALADELSALFYSWRVRCLHSVGKRYKETPNQALNDHARRILEIEVSGEDVRDIVETMDVLDVYKHEVRMVPIEKYRQLQALAGTRESPTDKEANDSDASTAEPSASEAHASRGTEP